PTTGRRVPLCQSFLSSAAASRLVRSADRQDAIGVYGRLDRREAGLITPELRKKIECCHSLPSPPGVATKIIELANDPDVDIARIADVLALDPAITAKILRIANSPMYARQRKTENLPQALMVIGLNATISL